MIYLQVNQTEVVLLTLFVLWKLCDNITHQGAVFSMYCSLQNSEQISQAFPSKNERERGYFIK